MTYSGELVMPTSYVEVAEEEMTYLDGGYYINVKRSTVGWVIDIGIAVFGLAVACSSQLGKIAAKVGLSKVKKAAAKILGRIGIKAAQATAAANLLGKVFNMSIGNAIGYVADWADKTGLNGRIQF